MVFRSARAISSIVIVVFLALLALGTSSYAQQTTGQLLISSGFNPIAATTPEMMRRLMSFPANQFLLRHKGSRSYYVYADPSDAPAPTSAAWLRWINIAQFWRVAGGHACLPAALRTPSRT